MKRKDKAKQTQHQQANPKAGAHYSPRSLFRNLTVPYSDHPGQRYLHPENHKDIREGVVHE